MTLATQPTRITSPTIDAGAARLWLNGYAERFQATGTVYTGPGRSHEEYTLPSESTERHYLICRNQAGHVTCSCQGYTHYGRCKHARLFAQTHGLAAPIDSERILRDRINELEGKIADLEEWLTYVADDLLTRTSASR